MVKNLGPLKSAGFLDELNAAQEDTPCRLGTLECERDTL
jgi:hypothetical protein